MAARGGSTQRGMGVLLNRVLGLSAGPKVCRASPRCRARSRIACLFPRGRSPFSSVRGPAVAQNSPCAPTTPILYLCECLYATTRPDSPVTSRRVCLGSNKADLETGDQWTPSSVLIRECKGGKVNACASVRIDCASRFPNRKKVHRHFQPAALAELSRLKRRLGQSHLVYPEFECTQRWLSVERKTMRLKR